METWLIQVDREVDGRWIAEVARVTVDESGIHRELMGSLAYGRSREDAISKATLATAEAFGTGQPSEG